MSDQNREPADEKKVTRSGFNRRDMLLSGTATVLATVAASSGQAQAQQPQTMPSSSTG